MVNVTGLILIYSFPQLYLTLNEFVKEKIK